VGGGRGKRGEGKLWAHWWVIAAAVVVVVWNEVVEAVSEGPHNKLCGVVTATTTTTTITKQQSHSPYQ